MGKAKPFTSWFRTGTPIMKYIDPNSSPLVAWNPILADILHAKPLEMCRFRSTGPTQQLENVARRLRCLAEKNWSSLMMPTEFFPKAGRMRSEYVTTCRYKEVPADATEGFCEVPEVTNTSGIIINHVRQSLAFSKTYCFVAGTWVLSTCFQICHLGGLKNETRPKKVVVSWVDPEFTSITPYLLG